MKRNNESQMELDVFLAEKLKNLEAVPTRDVRRAAAGKTAFLTQAAHIREEAVSGGREPRRNDWIATLFGSVFTQRKERSPMFGSLATIILVIALALGGGGITVAAAQQSLPDEPLYGLKLMGEEVQVRLQTGPEQQIDWALRLAERRQAELQRMLDKGKIPGEAFLARYQSQVEEALRLAAGLNDEKAIQQLARIQERFRLMEQALQGNGTPNEEAVLTRARLMLQERMNWTEEGQVDPDYLRIRLRDRDRINEQDAVQEREENQNQASPVPPAEDAAPAQVGPGQGEEECTDCRPGYGPGPGAVEQPGSGGNGPGPSGPQPEPQPQPTPQPEPIPSPGNGEPQKGKP